MKEKLSNFDFVKNEYNTILNNAFAHKKLSKEICKSDFKTNLNKDNRILKKR